MNSKTYDISVAVVALAIVAGTAKTVTIWDVLAIVIAAVAVAEIGPWIGECLELWLVSHLPEPQSQAVHSHNTWIRFGG